MSAQKKGPAEGATSPSHGSNNSQEGIAVTRQYDIMTPAGGATISFSPNGACVVAALADLLKAGRRNADAKHEAVSAFEEGSTDRDIASDRAIHAEDCYDALRNLIAGSEATSLEGAAMQIVEALSRIHAVYESLGDNAGHADREDHRATLRLLYSALNAVEARGHFNLSDLLPEEDLLFRRFDPWAEKSIDTSDPLLDLVRQYEAGMAAYNAGADEDDEAVKASYGPPYEALLGPSVPAPTTMEGALAALRLLVVEGKAHLDGQMAASVLPVVLGFLEREAA